MHPLFDSRFTYMAVDNWYRSMALPSAFFKAVADQLDERVSSPFVPEFQRQIPLLSFFRRSIGARFRLLERMTQSYQKPAFGIDRVEVEGRPVSVKQETVLETPFCHLLHFKKDMNARQPRLLMVAPMAGHYATLLRDTVRDSLPYFDVYITDWMNARDVPISHGAFDLDSYIALLVRFYEFLGDEEFHVMGICQSGVPAYAALCLLENFPDLRHFLPKTLTIMGSPIDVRRSPTSVNRYATQYEEGWFEHMALSIVPEGYKGERRLVYPGFMQLAAFISMNPQRHQKSIRDALCHYSQGDFEGEEKISSFYAEYLATMDMTAEFYLQTVRVVFQQALLPQGRLDSRGRAVDPLAVRHTAILAIEGERDDICGIGQTQAALDISRNLPDSKKQYLLLKNTGHYGLFNGHKYREQVLPVLRRFITKNSLKTHQKTA